MEPYFLMPLGCGLRDVEVAVARGSGSRVISARYLARKLLDLGCEVYGEEESWQQHFSALGNQRSR
jgi:hypothetical protein